MVTGNASQREHCEEIGEVCTGVAGTERHQRAKTSGGSQGSIERRFSLLFIGNGVFLLRSESLLRLAFLPVVAADDADESGGGGYINSCCGQRTTGGRPHR